MTCQVVLFPHGRRHGWYVGQDHLLGLLPGDEARWPLLWTRYCEQWGCTIADLAFADDQDRAVFARDVGVAHA